MDVDREPTEFEGVCRLFPLPSVVLFPHAMLPLHIFEPRYRQMTADALAGDRRIAMVKIRDRADWGEQADPSIESTACLSKIVDYQAIDDGTYNLLLVGVSRVRIIEEFPNGKLYRSARTTLIEDVETTDEPCLRRELRELFVAMLAREERPESELLRFLNRDLALGMTTDLLGHYLGLPREVKQAFLDEADVGERSRILIGVLRHHLGLPRDGFPETFPPPFSVN